MKRIHRFAMNYPRLLILNPNSVCLSERPPGTGGPVTEDCALNEQAGWRLVAALATWGAAGQASAEEITFGGEITQSTQDGTGPAVNNPSLNGIKDGDFYTMTHCGGSTSMNCGFHRRNAGATHVDTNNACARIHDFAEGLKRATN
jgi:hypothetical protein